MSTRIDHLVFAGPDLDQGIRHIEELLGTVAVSGGSHPGLGTRNALFGLGPDCYLEVIGPDPDQADHRGSRPFGINDLADGQLVTWVARRQDLRQFAQALKPAGLQLGESLPLARETEAGERLEWEMAFLEGLQPDAARVLPLFIDWGSTPHPALACDDGARLLALEVHHPRPPEIIPLVDALGLDIPVTERATAGIRAVINCPRGEIVLCTSD